MRPGSRALGCEGSHHEQCDVKFEAGSGEKPGRKGTGATSERVEIYPTGDGEATKGPSFISSSNTD